MNCWSTTFDSISGLHVADPCSGGDLNDGPKYLVLIVGYHVKRLSDALQRQDVGGQASDIDLTSAHEPNGAGVGVLHPPN